MAKKELTCRQALAWQKYENLNRQASSRAISFCFDFQHLIQQCGDEISRLRLRELDAQARLWYNTYPDTLEGRRWLYRRYRKLFRQYKLACVIEWVHRKQNFVQRKLDHFRWRGSRKNGKDLIMW